ncbi:MAG TPA: UDP-N-acetylmuramoyl-L-alanine--D-glutamate ligase [Acidimicrobiales bacterium]
MVEPASGDLPLQRAVVLGLGVTGRAVARALVGRGVEVAVVDDHPSEAVRAAAASLGVDLVVSPSYEDLATLVAGADALLPSPGIPDVHPGFAAARAAAVPVLSEFDLAARWDDRPIVAVTGTDGKTTVTTMVAEMLSASGHTTVACGNTETPLVDAIVDPAVDVFVVEASSFRLGHSRRFRPAVAVWLNFAPDHLDVHSSLAAYESAKARIWSDLTEGDGLAVANAEDPVVLANRNPDIDTVTFGPAGSGADATVVGTELRLPDGTLLVDVDELPRAMPHDVTNALAASVAALAAGAELEAVRTVLRGFAGLPHRVQLVAEADGVRWYDDSKATTPHATLAAVAGFDSVVLVAGGRNKGLDLSVLGGAVPPVRAVVAMGEAADEVAAGFAGRCPVRVATDIDAVVADAAGLAEPGDAVLLSPGCTSFDWFGSYAERGDAFAAAVRRLLAGAEGPS